jgi:hypothetical protein
MTTAPRRCPTHRLTAVTAALTALIAVALAVLLAKTIHTAAEHQSEIHTAGYHVTICTAQASDTATPESRHSRTSPTAY